MHFEMMSGTGFWGGWVGMAFGGLMMILWFALIIALIILVISWIGRMSNRTAGQNALDILKQRYAHGEINAAELEERTRQLRK